MKFTKYILILILIALPIFGFAQLGYEPLVPLPGQSPTNSTVDLGVYLSNMYKLLIAVAIILAIVMITYAGLEYMGTDSVFGKTDARGKIGNAVGGVVLALMSWLILYTINPAIVGFGFLSRPPAGVLDDFSVLGGNIQLYVNEPIQSKPVIDYLGQTPSVVISGDWPIQGVSVDNIGYLRGTPTSPGNYKITVTASVGDSTKEGQINILVNPERLVITPNDTVLFSVNVSYTKRYPINGGIPPYSVILSGTLPSGIAVELENNNLKVSGTVPIGTPFGFSSFSARIIDSSPTPLEADINIEYTIEDIEPRFCFDLIALDGTVIVSEWGCAVSMSLCNSTRSTLISQGYNPSTCREVLPTP